MSEQKEIGTIYFAYKSKLYECQKQRAVLDAKIEQMESFLFDIEEEVNRAGYRWTGTEFEKT